jgi:Na+-driven multidrug efflux pump
LYSHHILNFIFRDGTVGGGSVLSRALGAKDQEKLRLLFESNHDDFALSSFLHFRNIFSSEMLLFWAKGAIIQPATDFAPIILSVPFLALCMMGNNVIRAEGKLNFAMVAMIIPAFNIGLDSFIKVMDLGMTGAAYATSISILCVSYLYFGSSSFKRNKTAIHFKFNYDIIKEITHLVLLLF